MIGAFFEVFIAPFLSIVVVFFILSLIFGLISNDTKNDNNTVHEKNRQTNNNEGDENLFSIIGKICAVIAVVVFIVAIARAALVILLILFVAFLMMLQ